MKFMSNKFNSYITSVVTSKQRVMYYALCNILKAAKMFSRNDNFILNFKTCHIVHAICCTDNNSALQLYILNGILISE